MYYYIKNLQGDVMYIVNQTMAVVAKYAYDAYGNILYIRNGSEADVSGNANHLGNINPIRYRGYYYDNETGFYYLQSRYYDPVVGRFLNPDGFVSTGTGLDGFNMYIYCGNNPVMYVDPAGTCYYANGKWTHDAWEFTGGYQRKSDPGYYVGTTEEGKGVYIGPTDNYSTSPNSVKVVDSRDNVNGKGEPDPNFHVENSYRITDINEQETIIDYIMEYNINNPSEHVWSRTKTSLLYEWEIHNRVYYFGYAPDSTAHVDFNQMDEGKGYVVFAWERVIKPKLPF